MQDTSTPSQSTYSSLSFTQGFLLGQISITALIFLFIKFFIFGDAPTGSDYHLRHHTRRLQSKHRASFGGEANTNVSKGGKRPHTPSSSRSKKAPSVLRPTAPLTTTAILAKTYYNVHGHQPESLDWFNVLVAQAIAQFRTEAQQEDAILTTLTNLLNGDRRPEFLDEIKVTELHLGEEFPIFSNCRVIPVDGEDEESGGGGGVTMGGAAGAKDGSRLQARMDIDLSDAITLGVETKLVLNYPKPFVAVMPVALAISVMRFSGTLSVSFIESPHNATTSTDQRAPPTMLTFSFQPDYRLELGIHSLLGSRSRLQDVPKIAQLIESRLHAWLDERCVEPRFQTVVLPSLWPRKGQTSTRGDNEEGNRGKRPESSSNGPKDEPPVNEDDDARVRDWLQRDSTLPFEDAGQGAFSPPLEKDEDASSPRKNSTNENHRSQQQQESTKVRSNTPNDHRQNHQSHSMMPGEMPGGLPFEP